MRTFFKDICFNNIGLFRARVIAPSQLPKRLKEVGQELAFHFAANPELYNQLAQTIQTPKPGAASFRAEQDKPSDDLNNLRARLLNIGASDVFLLGMDGTVMSSTVDSVPSGQAFLYDQALRESRRRSQSGVIVPINGQPHLLVEAQIMAPLPVARVVMGFTMDADFARELHALSNLQVSIMTLTNVIHQRLHEFWPLIPG